MGIYELAGRKGRAVKVYSSFIYRLKKDLDIGPSPNLLNEYKF